MLEFHWVQWVTTRSDQTGHTCKLTAWNGLLETPLTDNPSYTDYNEPGWSDAEADYVPSGHHTIKKVGRGQIEVWMAAQCSPQETSLTI